MATTTNYGWTTPDDTALVKDGASAIRTLGSSVDTTTKALNPSTTLGDIEYRSSTANTNTRLGIGTTGQVLSVSGGVPAWATPAGGSWTQSATGSCTGTSITVSSLSAKQLLLIFVGVSLNTANTPIQFRLNGNTGNNYYNPETYGESFVYISGDLAAGEVHTISTFIQTADTASQAKAIMVAGDASTRKLGGSYQSTSAITSMTFFPASGSFDAGTYYVWSFA